MKLTMGCTTRPFKDQSFAAACKSIAKAGYTDVAVFADVGLTENSSKDEIAKIGGIARDAGLNPSMVLAHSQPDEPDGKDRYLRLIDNAAALGAKWLLDLGAGNRELLGDYVDLMKTAAAHADRFASSKGPTLVG